MCQATPHAAFGRRLFASLLMLFGATALAEPTVRSERSVESFTRIELSGPADLVFTQGTPRRVLVDAEARVIGRLTASVEDGVLRFDYGPAPFITRAPVRFLVRAPALDMLRALGSGDVRLDRLRTAQLELEAAGSGDIAIRSLSAGRLDVRHSGAGNLDVGGRVDTQTIDSSGSGDLDAASLRSQHARVRMRGSGDVALHVERQLDATLSGSGDLSVSGQAQVQRRISGSGELLRADELHN